MLAIQTTLKEMKQICKHKHVWDQLIFKLNATILILFLYQQLQKYLLDTGNFKI